jgi:hypothetical protein
VPRSAPTTPGPPDGARTPIVGLSIHRGYACRHSGVCCTSGWTIPVEAPLFVRLQGALTSGTIAGPAPDATPLLPFPQPFDGCTGLLGTDDEGCCAFYDAETAADEPARNDPSVGRCRVQRHLGHDALPHACQQFPRIAVLRPGSTAVSLSNYCPIAASLLGSDEPPHLEEWGNMEPRLLEGLDMRETLPPLLRPDALFSWSAFERWEAFVIATLADPRAHLNTALSSIAVTAERLRLWGLNDGDFDACVERWLEEVDDRCDELAQPAIADVSRDYALVRSTVPDELNAPALPDLNARWTVAAERLHDADAIVRAYLASRAWASWIGHAGLGVRSFVRWLRMARHVLTAEMCRPTRESDRDNADAVVEAARRADLLLVHLATPTTLVGRFGKLETVALM